MNSIEQLVARQAASQKARAQLSWPEKIRQAEVMRDTFAKLRASEIYSNAKPAVTDAAQQ